MALIIIKRERRALVVHMDIILERITRYTGDVTEGLLSWHD